MMKARLKVVPGHKMARKVELGIRMQMTQHSELAPVTAMMMIIAMIPTMEPLTQCIKSAHTIHQI